MPPVEAPDAKEIPMPKPYRVPPKNEAKKIFSVTGGKYENNCTKPDINPAPIMVLRVKSFPSIFTPDIKSTTFIMAKVNPGAIPND